MKIAFYPGCALEGMANDYGLSITAVIEALGISLVEIEDWSCCGATAAHSLSEEMSVALPARNPSITGFTDYENPRTLDLLASAAGAETMDWSYKSTCCGASIGMGRKDIQDQLTRKIITKARQTGAEAVVVSCSLCQSNLDIFQKDMKEGSLPVFYFTELLRLAFEEQSDPRWFKKHLTDPVPLLKAKGLV